MSDRRTVDSPAERPVGSLDEDSPSFRVPAVLYKSMIEHLRSELPFEGCGIVASESGVAVKVFPGTNTAASETRYNMDLAEIAEALEEIDRNGWRLEALFHSHPRSEPAPSETDRTHAYYPDAFMIIVSFASEPPEARAYRVDGDVREVPIEVI